MTLPLFLPLILFCVWAVVSTLILVVLKEYKNNRFAFVMHLLFLPIVPASVAFFFFRVVIHCLLRDRKQLV